MFAHYLAASMPRRAIAFMKKYIFKIPKLFLDVRERAFKLMYSCLFKVGAGGRRKYRQLISNNCEMLKRDSYHVLLEGQSNLHMRAMTIKWIALLS